MKIKLLFIAILTSFIAISSCSKQPATTYTITGNIQGLPDGSRIQLIPVSHDTEKPIADTVLVDGKFTFHGQASEPRLILLMVEGSYGSKKFMLDNSNIVINGEVEAGQRADNIIYDYENVLVTGSKINEQYEQKITVRDTLNALHEANAERHKDISSLINRASEAKNQKLVDSLRKSDQFKALLFDDSTFFKTVGDKYNKLFLDNKDSFWGPMLMIDIMSYFNKDNEKTFEAFSKEAKESHYGKLVEKELFPPSFVGKPVLNFNVKGDAGEFTFEDLRKGKKVVLLDFWASWCAPCRKEIPNLKNLYQIYASKGFEIVSISIDKKDADWTKALSEEKLPWPNYLDRSGIADLYQVKLIPSIFLVDENGILIAENIRGEELENKLKELFIN